MKMTMADVKEGDVFVSQTDEFVGVVIRFEPHALKTGADRDYVLPKGVLEAETDIRYVWLDITSGLTHVVVDSSESVVSGEWTLLRGERSIEVDGWPL